MALFSRKKNDDSATPGSASSMPTAPGAPVTEDFSAFADPSAPLADTHADDSAAGPKRGRKAAKAAKPAKPRGLKGGAVVGLNIGSESIKAIELKGKGSSVAVTAMGMIPTPAESISNGVVMSPTALSHAINDLFKQSGIKTKNIVTSVAGTGSLIVRVIEVPRMSDSELADNMKVDADRYIPFPPSEVIMDFKALRDLPSDPDAANMEVLLAAAQREVVDLHIKVLEGAKLQPMSIDVEPLAAARSLTYAGNGADNNGGGVDYNDVSALINIGATGTEISVLRGDVLVFTRSVPNGGNAITQALADNLGLAWPDAERVKCDRADALSHSTAGAYGAASGDMGAAYAGSDAAFGDTGYAPAPASAGEDWSDFDFDAASEEPAAVATEEAPVESAPESADPFDLDFFNQGPPKNEPEEQHQQKEGEGKTEDEFDFSSFAFGNEGDAKNAPSDDLSTLPAETSDDAAGVDEEHIPTQRMEGQSAEESPRANQTMEMPAVSMSEPASFDFSLHGDDDVAAHGGAPSGQMFQFDAQDDPALPSFPTLADNDDDSDLAALPTVTDEATTQEATPDLMLMDDLAEEGTPAESASSTGDAVFGFAFDEPVVTDAVEETGTVPGAATVVTGSGDAPSAYALDDLETSVSAASSSGVDTDTIEIARPSYDALSEDAAPVAGTATGNSATDALDDFDLESLAVPESAGVAATTSVGTDDFGTDDFAATDFTASDDALGGGLDDDSFGNFGDFGAGLGSDTAGISEDTIYSIVHPLLDELVGEVRRSLEYYGSRYPDAAVRRITLVGGGAKFTNIDAYFTQSLGIPTTTGNPVSRLTVRAPQLPPGYAEENGPIFAVALGLALRDVV